MEQFDVKIALSNYHRFKKGITHTEHKIEVLNARKHKVGGSFPKIPENPINRETVIINNLGKGECLEQTLSQYRYYVNLADCFINWANHRDSEMIRDKFVNMKSWEWISMNYYLTPRSARKRITALIDKFIDNT